MMYISYKYRKEARMDQENVSAALKKASILEPEIMESFWNINRQGWEHWSFAWLTHVQKASTQLKA